MKCSKCEKEISSEDKFCSNCGERIEQTSLTSTFDRSIDITRKMWFLFGFLRGKALRGKKKAKWFVDFEKQIETKMPEIWSEYEDTIEFWMKQAEDSDKNDR
ncbi:MAG: zinc ribbon domain-containing protein [archaeon]